MDKQSRGMVDMMIIVMCCGIALLGVILNAITNICNTINQICTENEKFKKYIERIDS